MQTFRNAGSAVRGKEIWKIEKIRSTRLGEGGAENQKERGARGLMVNGVENKYNGERMTKISNGGREREKMEKQCWRKVRKIFTNSPLLLFLFVTGILCLDSGHLLVHTKYIPHCHVCRPYGKSRKNVKLR